jgi:acyl-coenzyme A synthetase/AMP-(fatty) acid ligase
VDHQLKIRGIRIEPGEIESALLQNSTVQTAVVVGYPIGTNPEYLAAYVVMDTLHSTTPTELRQWLRERLPGYLVPAIIIPLDALPLTPNGKLDRGALPTPDFSNRSMDTDTDEPMTRVEVCGFT